VRTPKRSVLNDVTIRNDVAVRNNVAVKNKVVARPVRRYRRWAVEAAAGSTRRPPSYRRRRGIIPLRSASLCCFFFYVRPPSVSTPFGYSALVSAVSPYPWHPRLCYCIYLCPAVYYWLLLYRVLSLFSFSVNYCILHIAWLILNSGD